ncbi:MAG: endonuclease III domain-containing protein [candidate division NC10 bacterium]|nr:endonuclease III domain-containing protein [candidate division NC10 bacterium]
MRKRLLRIYEALYAHFGPQRWWPADGAFEVVVGAILTQNTSWRNVEKAMVNLRTTEVLSPGRMLQLKEEELARLIRPSGTYRVKANRLLRFLSFLKEEYGSDLQAMLHQPMAKVRAELLQVKGIGPETADSILLYAGGYPIFVVDAYTKRILSRHGLAREGSSYQELQGLLMGALPADGPLFNEYHALLVRLGKSRCLGRPRCDGCVLEPMLDDSSWRKPSSGRR